MSKGEAYNVLVLPTHGAPMTGKELYDMYVEAGEMNGTKMDSWDDIDEADVQIWEDLSDLISQQVLSWR